MPLERRTPLFPTMMIALVCLGLMTVVAEAPCLEFSTFQQRVLTTPEDCDLFLGGGRGGGKSYTLALLAMRHAELYRDRARILYLRQSFPGAADFVTLTRGLFGQVYGTSAKYNASSHVWTLPTGSYFEINQLESPADYSKFQGRSFSLLLIDEAQQWPDPAMLDMLRSNLRGCEGIPVRVVIAANPGGIGHQWIAQRYVFRSAPWVPFHEDKSGQEWIYSPSTFLDNDHIDQESYRKQVEASTATDPELGRAWLEGDWTVARGAYFGGVLEESRNCVDPWPRLPEDPPLYDWRGWKKPLDCWDLYLAYDHGSSAPAVCYVVARSPGGNGADGRFYPRDSIVLIDELATYEPGAYTKGMGYTIPRIAEEIREMADRWNMRSEGVADDAIFAQHGSEAGSIADEFRRCGVDFLPAEKGSRVHGWETMRRMLADAGKPDVPGLYIARTCEYFWATVPYLDRDPRRVEDLDSRGPDHAADACRYGLRWSKPIITTTWIRRS